jgi:hypothetical protein
MLKIATFLSLVFLIISTAQATQVVDTIYINRGLFTAFNGVQFDYLSFNNSSVFNQTNHRMVIGNTDTLSLSIINNDTVVHGFAVKNTSINELIAVDDTITISYSNVLDEATIYYDPTAENSYLGLAGMIVTTEHSANFFWNMKEHQKDWNTSIVNGGTVDWSTYYPDYFTINGNSNPDINSDAAAKVVGNVGDTLRIYMVNTGVSLHAIHFHGYHSEIIYSSKFPLHEGRSKDSFPVYPMEIVVLEMVPDQPGEYPVHDHNLVAVSGGGMYPNGMFLTLLID